MDRIVAMIPLKDGHAIKREVYEALCSQIVDVDIMPVSRPMSDGVRGIKEGYISMSECRNIIKNNALEQYGSKYFLMLNRDVVLSSPHDVKDMINYLEENKDFSAVAINTRKSEVRNLVDMYHTDVACMLIRREALESLEFNNSSGCNCRCVCNFIKNDLDKKVGYLDHRKCLEI